mgnify:CR=1 FL=1|tara:strand:+ start:44506 stop:44982 length:477 start_codon:yes stop_codon:yes gene_type:complete
MNIREATPADVPAIRLVIRSSIEGIARDDYDSEVLLHWGKNSSKAVEMQQEAMRTGHELTWVAIDSGVVVGFSALDPFTGTIRGVYVASEFARQQLGTALLEKAEGRARALDLKALSLHSTITAKQFYETHGYEVLEEVQHTLRSGVKMTAFAMTKTL